MNFIFLISVIFFITCLILIGVIIKKRKAPSSLKHQSGSPSKHSSAPLTKPKADLYSLIQDQLGQLLKNRYKDVKVESISGAGVNVTAIDLRNQQKYQIKAINPELQNDEKAQKLFTAEMEAIKRINHPNIIKVIETGADPSILYYVTEFLDGDTLEAVIQKQGKIPLNQAIHITTQILKALLHCHNNKIVHRDIRPSNIFITKNNVIKLINFGIVKILSSQGDRGSSTIIGGPDFGSPEQIQGLPITHKSDIFSMGVCLFYMLCNEFPFPNALLLADPNSKGEDIKKYCPDLPAEVYELIEICLEKDPSKRLTTIDVWKKIHFMK